MSIQDKIQNELDESSIDSFKFKLNKVLSLNKSQMNRIVGLAKKGDYRNAIIAYKNFLQTSEEAAMNFIIGLAAAENVDDKKKFGKTGGD